MNNQYMYTKVTEITLVSRFQHRAKFLTMS